MEDMDDIFLELFNETSEKKEVTNEDIMNEIKRLSLEVDVIRRMIYETNCNFYDTWQIACSGEDTYGTCGSYRFRPLTNRELLLRMINKIPVADLTNGVERLFTQEELVEKYGEHYRNVDSNTVIVV